MLISDVVKDYSQSVLIKSEGLNMKDMDVMFKPLMEKGNDDMYHEQIPEESILIERSLDVRYVGQSYEISVPFRESYMEDFNMLHKKMYGYSDPNRDCEIVNLRIRMRGKVPKPRLRKEQEGGESPLTALVGKKKVIYQGESILFNLYHRERLSPGNRFRGPAILTEYSSTLLLPPDFSCTVDGYGNLILEHFNRKKPTPPLAGEGSDM